MLFFLCPVIFFFVILFVPLSLAMFVFFPFFILYHQFYLSYLFTLLPILILLSTSSLISLSFQADPTIFIRGFSSNKPLISRINILRGYCHPSLRSCWQAVIQFKQAKERERREERATISCNILWPSKVANEWCNIPLCFSLSEVNIQNIIFISGLAC